MVRLESAIAVVGRRENGEVCRMLKQAILAMIQWQASLVNTVPLASRYIYYFKSSKWNHSTSPIPS